jgi:hypothetical protein
MMTIQWTPEAIRALGATTDLHTLGEIFGLSTWRSREMAKAGEWEQIGIRILKMGSRYRVTVPSILNVLVSRATTEPPQTAKPPGVTGPPETAPAPAPARTTPRPSQPRRTGTRTAPPRARQPRKPPSTLTSCLRETAISGPRLYAHPPRSALRTLSVRHRDQGRVGNLTDLQDEVFWRSGQGGAPMNATDVHAAPAGQA